MIEDIRNNQMTIRSSSIGQGPRLKLFRLKKEGLLCDIRITAGHKTIDAHKVVLCICSDYFETMLTSQFVEGNRHEIEIQSVDPEALEAVINFFYTGYLQINYENVQEMIKVADLLLLDEIKTSIGKFLKLTLNVQNCIPCKEIGDVFFLSEVQEASARFMVRNFSEMCKHQLHLDLPFTDLSNILSSKALVIDNEENLLEDIIAWSKNSPDRESKLKDLLPLVNLKLISETALANLQDTHVKKLVNDIRLQAMVQPEPLRCQNRLDKIIVAVSFDSRSLEYLNLDDVSSGWSTLTEVAEMRYGFSGAGICSHVDSIFVTGGVGSGGILKAVNRFLVYNLRTNDWFKGPSMINRRKCHSSGIITDPGSESIWLVVLGGTDERLPVLSVEILDLSKPRNEWKWKHLCNLEVWHNGSGLVRIDTTNATFVSLASYGAENDKILSYSTLNENAPNILALQSVNQRLSRDRVGVASSGKNIFVAGGSLGREILKTTEVYDSGNKLWRRVADMSVAREGPGLVFADGKLWAIGGRGSDGCVEILDPIEDKWTILENIGVKDKNNEYFAVVLQVI